MESPGSMLRGCRALYLFLFVGFGVSLPVRNSFSNSRYIALKTIADLAKIRKSQVTFAVQFHQNISWVCT